MPDRTFIDEIKEETKNGRYDLDVLFNKIANKIDKLEKIIENQNKEIENLKKNKKDIYREGGIKF